MSLFQNYITAAKQGNGQLPSAKAKPLMIQSLMAQKAAQGKPVPFSIAKMKQAPSKAIPFSLKNLIPKPAQFSDYRQPPVTNVAALSTVVSPAIVSSLPAAETFGGSAGGSWPGSTGSAEMELSRPVREINSELYEEKNFFKDNKKVIVLTLVLVVIVAYFMFRKNGAKG